MAGGSGSLKRLSISPCDVLDNGDVRVSRSKFEVMLNPSSYQHSHVISYDRAKVFGQLAPVARFSGAEGEEVSFDLLLDGTGVVPPGRSGEVADQLRTLNGIVYKYDGDKHEPNVVRVHWGSLIFFGRLKSMSVDHSLFRPDGSPLRAKAKLSFVGFMSRSEEALRANRSSPDLSHTVEVRPGDTLPLLCYRIYRDSSYYPEVARHNGLSDFRTLEPGSRIRFPPLRGPEPEPPPDRVRKYPRDRA